MLLNIPNANIDLCDKLRLEFNDINIVYQLCDPMYLLFEIIIIILKNHFYF